MIWASIRNRNGTTRLVYGSPTSDGSLVVGEETYPAGSWFANRSSDDDIKPDDVEEDDEDDE
jgi:hypothetical protein